MEQSPTKLLGVSLNAQSGRKPPFFREELRRNGYVYTGYGLGTESTFSILAKSFFLPLRLADHDVVITSEYFSSFGINLRLLVTGARAKHVTIGLNQSRRLLKSGIRWIDGIIDYVFRRSDLVIVHSRAEARLFGELHKIPAEKFYFSHWGFDLPTVTRTRFSTWPRPFVSLVGRNNRDIKTFARALEGMSVDGIVITSRQHAPSWELPPNVHVYYDLPLNETLDCIRNARANTILLLDGERGAGHITAVAAMFAGVPQIVSDVDVIKDYLVDGFSAMAVPLGDHEAVSAAIKTIIENSGRAAELSANARGYADRWLTNERVSERIVNALNGLRDGDENTTVDPNWLAAYEGILSRHCVTS